MKLDDLIREFRATSGEPLWRVFLNWGTVIAFFAIPLTLFCVQFYARTHPGWFNEEHPEHFKYIADYQRNLTILVFGLAGLKTWENIKNNKPKSHFSDEENL